MILLRFRQTQWRGQWGIWVRRCHRKWALEEALGMALEEAIFIHLKMEVQTTDMYDVEGASVRRERTAEKTQGKLQLGLSHQSGGRREPCGG